MNVTIECPSSSPLVLIVDDDLTTTLLLERVLQGAGFETLSAGDIAGAQSLLGANPVSLLLLDVNLPDGNGLDFCRKITAVSTVPVLFISSNDDTEIKVLGFAAGAVDYVTKPFAGPEILARVRTHLRLKAAYDALAGVHEEKIARLVASQQALMPSSGDFPEARFSVCMRQALLAGGDFYDVRPAGSRITDYIVADASGHDLGVSLWTAAFKTLLSEYASVLYTPLEICRILNNSLLRILPEAAYFTAIYVRLNRKTNRMVLVNAGHPSVIYQSAREGISRVVEQEGDLLGIFQDVEFGVLELPVIPGDRLFLYSDGLLERGSTRGQGTVQLLQALDSLHTASLEETVRSVVDMLCADAVPEDDIVLLGLEI